MVWVIVLLVIVDTKTSPCAAIRYRKCLARRFYGDTALKMALPASCCPGGRRVKATAQASRCADAPCSASFRSTPRGIEPGIDCSVEDQRLGDLRGRADPAAWTGAARG